MGGRLVEIKTAEEQHKIESLIKPHVRSYFIGGRKMRNGKFEWADKSKMVFKNWAKGQPGARAHAPCVAIVDGSTWRNVNCFHKSAFICAKRTAVAHVHKMTKATRTTHIKAHRHEMARRAAIVDRLHTQMVATHTAEMKMSEMLKLKNIAVSTYKHSITIRHAAEKHAHHENEQRIIAVKHMHAAIKLTKLANLRLHEAQELTTHAKHRASAAAFAAGVAEGKRVEEVRRRIEAEKHCHIAIAEAKMYEEKCKKAVSHKLLAIATCTTARNEAHEAHQHLKMTLKECNLSLIKMRKTLAHRIIEEGKMHKTIKHQRNLTVHAEFEWKASRTARLVAERKQKAAHEMYMKWMLKLANAKKAHKIAVSLRMEWDLKQSTMHTEMKDMKSVCHHSHTTMVTCMNKMTLAKKHERSAHARYLSIFAEYKLWKHKSSDAHKKRTHLERNVP
jgi:hypothetical protein